ncbi:putative peptidase YegQ [Moraxella catarrhalis]|nr:putative peptidase YegQ [Moraxella catarrhalis]
MDISDDFLTLEIKNKLMVGDDIEINDIEIMTPKGNLTYTLTKMWDKKGNDIDGALGSGWIAKIKNPFSDICDDELKFALVMKSVSEAIYS